MTPLGYLWVETRMKSERGRDIERAFSTLQRKSSEHSKYLSLCPFKLKLTYSNPNMAFRPSEIFKG